MNIHNLVIETTRRCNMSCEHCLRGVAESMDMKRQYIDTLLEQVDYIGSITFSGGEPSLNVDIIEYTLSKMKELDIELGSFYIATNGKDIKEDFVIACLRLYAYSDKDENMCQVQVSNDGFHSNEGSYNTELLDGLSFFSRKDTEESRYFYGDDGAINQGRYKENYGDGRELTACEIKTMDDFDDEDIYLNCNGDIINGCDWSYEEQDNNIICKVDELKSFYDSLAQAED